MTEAREANCPKCYGEVRASTPHGPCDLCRELELSTCRSPLVCVRCGVKTCERVALALQGGRRATAILDKELARLDAQKKAAPS